MLKSDVKIKVAEPSKIIKDRFSIFEVIREIIEEHYDLKKLKEVEKTKRTAIKKTTEIILKKLDIIEKLGLKAIENDRNLKEAVVKIVGKKLENSDDPEVVALCVNILVETLKGNSLKEELETIAKLVNNNKEIEI